MPSTGTFSIGTGGRDYSTISGWEADTDVSLTGVVTGECYADSAFDEDVDISGASSLSETVYRHLTVADGEKHSGVAGTGAVLAPTNTGFVDLVEDWSRVSWLELDYSSGTAHTGVDSSSGAFGHHIHHLLIHDLSTSAYVKAISRFNNNLNTADLPVHIYDNIIYDVESTGTNGEWCRGLLIRCRNGSSNRALIYNNTVHKVHSNDGDASGIALETYSSDDAYFRLKNNAVTDVTTSDAKGRAVCFERTDSDGTLDVDSSTNASSDSTAGEFGGTGHLTGISASNQYVSLTDGSEDFHLVSTADVADAGVDLGDVAAKIDIDGGDRHGAAVVWDIGADEEELAGGQALVEFVDDVLQGAESVSFDVVTQVVQYVSESAQLAETRDRVRGLVRVAGEVLNPSEALYFLGGYFTANDVWNRTAVDARPAAPSNLSATAVSDSRIDLSWTDNASTEDEFQVYRDGLKVATLAANTTSYSDTGLASATQYCYEVRACNEHGCSSFSNQACATTDAGVPSAPSNLSASEKLCSGSAGDVELTFTDNSDNEDSWVVYKDGSLFDEVTSSTSGSTGTITITATGSLTPGESATFEVAAKNADGESAKSNSSSVTVETVPSAPSGLTASWSSQFCNVSLSWTDNASNECEFVVYRDGVEIARPAADSTSYTDTNANANTSYTYEVAAANDLGESATDSTSITTGDCNLS